MRRKRVRQGANYDHAGSFRRRVRLRSRAGALAALAAALFAAPAPAAAASAPGLAEVQADFRGELALAGGASSAFVYDLTAKSTLFSERASVLRRPASVEKLFTATTALEELGPDAQLSTSVLGAGR